MNKDLLHQVNEILSKEIDPIFIEISRTIVPELPNPKYMPWLLAHKMSVDSAKILLALPDEWRESEYSDFQVSEEFAKKLGMKKDYVEEQVEERYFSGDITLNPKKGPVLTLSRGLWIDIQHSKKWIKRNGPAFYHILGIMTDEEFTQFAEAHIQTNIDEGRTGVARIIPRYDSVKDCKELLPIENYKEVLKSKKRLAQLNCICRLRYPEYGQDGKVCLAANEMADLAIKMEIAEEISWEDAFEYVQKVGKKEPHIHESKHATTLSEAGNILCNCNAETCSVLRRATNVGGKFPYHEFYGKSRFRAEIEADKCIDCGLCHKKRCMFDAIRVMYNRELGTEKPHVNETLCVGCGCCVETCPTNAIKMNLVAPPEILSGNYRGDDFKQTDPVEKEKVDFERIKTVLEL